MGQTISVGQNMSELDEKGLINLISAQSATLDRFSDAECSENKLMIVQSSLSLLPMNISYVM